MSQARTIKRLDRAMRFSSAVMARQAQIPDGGLWVGGVEGFAVIAAQTNTCLYAREITLGLVCKMARALLETRIKNLFRRR